MGVKFFCNECGTEIFKSIDTMRAMTIAEIEKVCICRYCLMPADMTYTTRADFYGFGEVKTIVIEKKGIDVFVNKRKAEMMHNGIQLRFEVAGVGTYIVFDDDSSHDHNPPRPIKEMYESLKS